VKLTGKKFLLILLYAPIEGDTVNTPISGRTRLMKMGFLFREEVLPDFGKDRPFEEIDLPEYFAWKYGPFSRDLLNDLEFLINQQYIKVGVGKSAPIFAEVAEFKHWIEDLEEFEATEYEEDAFELTEEKGIPKAGELWRALSQNQQKLLSEFKRVLNQAPLDRILEYVYRRYKDEGYVDKSVVKERYLY